MQLRQYFHMTAQELFAAGQIGRPWSMAPTKGVLLICLQNPQFNAIKMV